MRIFLPLIAILVASTFARRAEAAPTASLDQPRDVVILWHTLDHRQALFLERLIREFNGATGALVKLETGMDLVQALIEVLDEGAAPDAVLAPADVLGLARRFRLSTVPDDLSGRRFGTRIAQTTVVDGRAVGVPIIDGNHLLLLYNRRLLPTPPARLEDFAVPRSDATPAKIAWLHDDAYVFTAFLGAFGGLQNDQAPALSSAAMSEALTQYRRAVKELLPERCGYDCVTGRFYGGELPAVINGEWALRDAQDRLGDDLGVAALPTVAGRPLTSQSTTQALFFPGGALEGAKRETLLRLGRFLQSAEIQRRWHDEAQRIPVDPTVLGAVIATADRRGQLVLNELARAPRIPTTRAMAYAWPALHKGLSLFLAGVQDAPTASAYMQRLAATMNSDGDGDD